MKPLKNLIFLSLLLLSLFSCRDNERAEVTVLPKEKEIVIEILGNLVRFEIVRDRL